MCMGTLHTCMYMYHMCAVPPEPKESAGFSGTAATDICKLPCGCRKLNHPEKGIVTYLFNQRELGEWSVRASRTSFDWTAVEFWNSFQIFSYRWIYYAIL